MYSAVYRRRERNKESEKAVLDLNIRSKNFRCIIIFVQKIFVRFQRTKIFLRRKKANYGILESHDCTPSVNKLSNIPHTLVRAPQLFWV